MKKTYYFIIFALLVACTSQPKDTGLLKLYDENNKIVFTSHRIKEVIIDNNKNQVSIILSKIDSGKLAAPTANRVTLKVYIDEFYIAKVTVVMPITSDFLQIDHLSDTTPAFNAVAVTGLDATLYGYDPKK